MNAHTSARLQVAAAAVLFSTGATAIKATAFDAWQVAGLRSGIAAAALLLLVPGSRRGWGVWPVLAGVGYAATLVCFVTASKLTTAANAFFLQATAPLYLMIAGPWLLKEKNRPADLAVLAVTACGMALFFVGEAAPRPTAPDPARGNLLAAVAGLTWAASLAGLRAIQRRSETGEAGLAMVVAGNAMAALVALPLGWPLAGGAADWAAVLYLGVIQIGLAYVCLTRGVRGVTALEASILLLAEPALGPLWAGLVHGEWPSALPAAGGALILAATGARVAVQARSFGTTLPWMSVRRKSRPR